MHRLKRVGMVSGVRCEVGAQTNRPDPRLPSCLCTAYPFWTAAAKVSLVCRSEWTSLFVVPHLVQDYAAEIAYLKKKVHAGADFIITQVRAGPT